MNDAAVWEESGTGALFSNKVGRRSPVMGGMGGAGRQAADA